MLLLQQLYTEILWSHNRILCWLVSWWDVVFHISSQSIKSAPAWKFQSTHNMLTHDDNTFWRKPRNVPDHPHNPYCRNPAFSSCCGQLWVWHMVCSQTCDGLYRFAFCLVNFGIPLGLYSEIDQIHLSSEAQCVSHHLPLVDCHTSQFLLPHKKNQIIKIKN